MKFGDERDLAGEHELRNARRDGFISVPVQQSAVLRTYPAQLDWLSGLALVYSENFEN